MVCEICYQYGYLPSQALALPVRQFFTLYKYGKKFMLCDRLADIEISAIGIGSYEYYKNVFDRYFGKLLQLENQHYDEQIRNNALSTEQGFETFKNILR